MSGERSLLFQTLTMFERNHSTMLDYEDDGGSSGIAWQKMTGMYSMSLQRLSIDKMTHLEV